MSDNRDILNALLERVSNSEWSLSDELVGIPESSPDSHDVFEYVKFRENGLRVPLYEEDGVSEGVELVFEETPHYNNSNWTGGSFKIYGFAVKNDKEEVMDINHQCHVGGRAGFKGAVYTLGNLINMKKEGTGYRPYFQVMAPVLKSVDKAEEKVGIKNSPLRDIYYNLYKNDIETSVDYLLNNRSKDGFGEWSGWYGLGSTLVNVLNMDLTSSEEKELTETLSHAKLIPYISKILESGEFTDNGMRDLEKVLNKIMSKKENIILKNASTKLSEKEYKAVKELVNDYGVDLKNVAYDNTVRSLNFRDELLNCLPETIYNFENLEKLNLRRNNLYLSGLPETIDKLKSLKNLYLGNNNLNSRILPKSIWDLENLQILKLGQNKLKHLPESIGKLSNLETLYVRSNKLKELPESIGNLGSLKRLDLGWNKLKDLPESIGDLENLEELYLGDNKLTHFPDIICNLNSLEKLHLPRNKLDEVPESIGRLRNLKLLHLYDNRLRSLPESISNLSRLEKLYLKNNNLEDLPESVKKLKEKGTTIY